ncbi:MAG: hypothetical protein ACK4S0_06825 [Sediminibacterium sp.]
MKSLAKCNLVFTMPSSVYLSLLFLIWSAIFFPTFYNYSFIWDDMHLVRAYTSEELQSVLFGHWDPDKVETAAYRPFATLVYHLQGFFFGENTICHRVFNLLLLFSLLQILVLIAKQLEIPKIQIWVALTIIVFSRIFITLAIWITMSQIITSYLLITLSVLFFIRSARSRFALNITLSFIFYIVALLTREESYILPFLLVLVTFISDIFKIKKKYYWIAGIMLILLVVHFYIRHLVVKDYMSNKPFNFSYGGVIYFLSSVWLPGGDY